MAAPNPANFAPIQGLLRITDGYTGSGAAIAVNPYGAMAAETTGKTPCYAGGIINYTPQATPQDFFTLTGNALVVAKLRKVEVWIGATAAAAMELQLVYNTAPDTGGTAATPVAVPIDPNNPVPLCVLQAYSVAPTPGTTLGPIAVGRVAGPILAGAGAQEPITWLFGDANDMCPTLRTANQQIALNGNGAALPSGIKFSIRFTWTEVSVLIPGG
jgi:hypothetical protein